VNGVSGQGQLLGHKHAEGSHNFAAGGLGVLQLLDALHLDGLGSFIGIRLLLQLSQEKNLLYQKVGSFRAVASHLEQLERQLRSSMPQHVMDMLGQQAAYLSQ